MKQQRHERPIKRTNPSGKTVWVARWTDRRGKRSSAGTFAKQKDAQAAIDQAYELDALGPVRKDTVGAYAAEWTSLHPRSDRTDYTNNSRIRQVLDVKLDGVRLRDWPYGELKRRHAVALVDVMLREQGRAAAGAQNILRTLSAMTEDAITDEVADANPFKGVKVRANDPRVQKAPVAVRVFSWQDMHRLCAAAALPKLRAGKEPAELSELDRWRAVYAEPMLRVLADCGLRLGELMPLERRDLDGQVLHVRRTAHEGRVLQGTKTDHGHAGGGRVVPVPPALAQLLLEMPKRIDSPLLFPTVRGRLWRERNWYRDVWDPARERTGLDARPHEFRHSWVSHLSAAGVDEAALADMAGHTVATMTGRYRHAVRDDFDAARAAVGA